MAARNEAKSSWLFWLVINNFIQVRRQTKSLLWNVGKTRQPKRIGKAIQVRFFIEIAVVIVFTASWAFWELGVSKIDSRCQENALATNICKKQHFYGLATFGVFRILKAFLSIFIYQLEQ